jgi:hypothetical protein
MRRCWLTTGKSYKWDRCCGEAIYIDLVVDLADARVRFVRADKTARNIMVMVSKR